MSESARRLWFGDGLLPSLGRAALAIPSVIYEGVMAARNVLYEDGGLATRTPAIPAIAVGNITVGGTGKTPIAAEIARRLRSRGARPAILLRGVGGDEPLVHRVLVPEAIVIADPDRVRGAAAAHAAGADVAVLDDAFQHRAIARVADIVLLAAEDAMHEARMLPAGPYREPLSALRRASLILITRKRATDADVDRAIARAARAAPAVPIAVARLSLSELRTMTEREPLEMIRGRQVLAIAGVGDPRSFAALLQDAGADVTLAAFADHHAYTAADAVRLSERVEPDSLAVCTLKDFVKLSILWPRDAAPLWYASQGVHIERGEETVDALIDRVFALRTHDKSPAPQPPAAY